MKTEAKRWAKRFGDWSTWENLQCSRCFWYAGERRCAAFPKEIPDAIWYHRVRHVEPYPGDRGIRYQPKDKRPAI